VARVVLVAPPDFLGLLRDALSEKSRRMVELEIDKNLVKLSAAEIRAHLPEKLYSAVS
jgi:protein required for attachment to host cells